MFSGKQTRSPKKLGRKLTQAERAAGMVSLSVAAPQVFIDADQKEDWEHKKMLKMQYEPRNLLKNKGKFL